MIRSFWQKQNDYTRALFCGLLIAFALFLPFMILDSGYFLYYGDFNVQQVPFYQMAHDAIRSGNIKWSWTTDLGANFIGSYSFYLLGSPFFWLTLPFPSHAVPYLMGPLLILKFGCATLTGFTYLRRYVKTAEYGILGGLLYAFSGFSIYNIFFNHFHEAIVFFPLLLWALDEYMEKRRRGVFAFMVFVCCFVNYYFFVGQVVFCVLYFFARALCGTWRLSVRDFLLLAAEAVIGLICSSAILIPTILCVVQNPRVDNPATGWGALLYGFNQRYIHILQSMFFPPDIPARPNFTPDSEAKWASLGAWLPLFSMAGVFGFFQSRRKSWLRAFLPILFLMAFVPILNSAFQLFNASYYARWFYMLTLMMTLATLRAVEHSGTNWKRAILQTLGITLGIALPIGLMPKETAQAGSFWNSIGLEDYPTRFWAYVAIAVLSLLFLAVLLKHLPFHLRKDTLQAQGYTAAARHFGQQCICGTAIVILVYGSYVIALGKTQADENHLHMIPYSLNQGKDLNLPGAETSRLDVYDGMDNQGMFFQLPTIQAFHSIVPGSIMEFYPTVGVTRDVGSRPEVKYYGLRAFTSTKWLLDPVKTGKSFGQSFDGTQNPLMPGWTYYGTQNGFEVWKNDAYIPLGFGYDSYVTREEYDAVPEDQRHLLLLKAMVLTQEQVQKYGSLFHHLDTSEQMDYSQQAYFVDCAARRRMASSSFERDNDGFTAKVDADESRLIFFSVPYESGWSATVNGKPAQIEKVNVGFMAVQVPAGGSTIRFEYQTPGLSLGISLSGIGAGFLLLYMVLCHRFFKDTPLPRKVYRIKATLPTSHHLTADI